MDSSLGGKGAVDMHVRGRVVKNPVGVFHYADEAWICPELFETLSDTQRREGALEAWKMVVSLDAKLFRSYTRKAPALERLVKDARRLKESVCARDPYEHEGLRRVLNFGHTFGHVLESVSRFKLSHGGRGGPGDAVRARCGPCHGHHPRAVALQVEQAPPERSGRARPRAHGRPLKRTKDEDLRVLLAADKKTGAAGEVRMILLTAIGATEVRDVSADVWRALWPAWTQGIRP